MASFLGATTIREAGLGFWGWLALTALVLGLTVGAPWKLKFSIDAALLYNELYLDAVEEAEAGTLGWLARAGCLYQSPREENAPRVAVMARISEALGALMVVQTLRDRPGWG